MTSVLMNITMEIQWRCRLGSRGRAKCALDAPLPMRADHVFTTIILNLNLFELFFFFFQLASSISVLRVLRNPRSELIVP